MLKDENLIEGEKREKKEKETNLIGYDDTSILSYELVSRLGKFVKTKIETSSKRIDFRQKNGLNLEESERRKFMHGLIQHAQRLF